MLRHKYTLDKINIGKTIEVATVNGPVSAIVTDLNEIFFVAATATRKFRLSFETGKIKEITESKPIF